MPTETQKIEIGGGDIPLATDPTTRARIEAFLRDKEVAEVAEEKKVSPQEDIQISPDSTFEKDGINDEMLRSVQVDIRNVDVTDVEKRLYMKALVMDEPVTLTIELLGGAMKFEFRSRLMHEHIRILDVMDLDAKTGIIPSDNPAMFQTRLQQYLCCVMLRRLNGELFSDLELRAGASLEEDAKKLRDAYDRKMQMGQPRWTAMLNALRMFEAKCARLASECANESFWAPQS